MAIKLENKIKDLYGLNKNDLLFIVLGSGGTGSYIAEVIYTLSRTFNKIKYCFMVDGDIVEEKNLNRQRFFEMDVGKKKSDVIANRYNVLNRVKYFSFPYFVYRDISNILGDNVKSYSDLTKFICDNINDNNSIITPIIINCFDTSRTRLDAFRYYIDTSYYLYVDNNVNYSEPASIIMDLFNISVDISNNDHFNFGYDINKIGKTRVAKPIYYDVGNSYDKGQVSVFADNIISYLSKYFYYDIYFGQEYNDKNVEITYKGNSFKLEFVFKKLVDNVTLKNVTYFDNNDSKYIQSIFATSLLYTIIGYNLYKCGAINLDMYKFNINLDTESYSNNLLKLLNFVHRYGSNYETYNEFAIKLIIGEITNGTNKLQDYFNTLVTIVKEYLNKIDENIPDDIVNVLSYYFGMYVAISRIIKISLRSGSGYICDFFYDFVGVLRKNENNCNIAYILKDAIIADNLRINTDILHIISQTDIPIPGDEREGKLIMIMCRKYFKTMDELNNLVSYWDKNKNIADNVNTVCTDQSSIQSIYINRLMSDLFMYVFNQHQIEDDIVQLDYNNGILTKTYNQILTSNDKKIEQLKNKLKESVAVGE